MLNMTYRCLIEIPPSGNCVLTIPDYPDYSIMGRDISELLVKVQTEVPEFLFMQACSKRSYRPPTPHTAHEDVKPGTLVYYVETRLPRDLTEPTVKCTIRLPESQWKAIDMILTDHPYLTSQTHFVAYAVERLVDALLIDRQEELEHDFRFNNSVFFDGNDVGCNNAPSDLPLPVFETTSQG